MKCQCAAAEGVHACAVQCAPGCSRCRCLHHVAAEDARVPWLAVNACCALNAPAHEDQLSGRIARADALAAAAAAASGRWAGPASSRRPKILSSIDCGGDAAGEADADSVVAALPAAAASAAARFSMDASESPGMSGRLEGRSQGWAAVPVLPLTLIGCAATSDAGGVGGCMSARGNPVSEYCIIATAAYNDSLVTARTQLPAKPYQ